MLPSLCVFTLIYAITTTYCGGLLADHYRFQASIAITATYSLGCLAPSFR